MIDKPDLSMFEIFELTDLLVACGQSDDPSDIEFAAYCRDEIKRRKPSTAAGERSPEEKA